MMVLLRCSDCGLTRIVRQGHRIARSQQAARG